MDYSVCVDFSSVVGRLILLIKSKPFHLIPQFSGDNCVFLVPLSIKEIRTETFSDIQAYVLSSKDFFQFRLNLRVNEIRKGARCE